METIFPDVDPKPAPIVPPSDWEFEDEDYE